jgi:hypothetical protein
MGKTPMKTILLATAAVLLLAMPAFADAIDNDPSVHIMHDYVLTMPKLKAYDAAYSALTTAAKADKSLQSDLTKASAENDQTIAQTIGKMDHYPRVYAFFQKQGLSKAEASLVPLILMSACTVAEYPTAQAGLVKEVAPSQAAFCKTNMAAIKGLHFFSGQ